MKNKKSPAKKNANAVAVQLPPMTRSGASWHDLLISWSDEFASQASRVRHLIGDAHWLSDGEHKETLIRAIFRSKLPDRLSVSQGFVLDPNTAACSPQCDILLLDTHLAAPFFSFGGLTVSSPESCIGVVEVKSTFRSSVLRDAIESVCATDGIVRTRVPNVKFWKGVMFADWPRSRTHETVIGSIVEVLKECFRKKSDSEIFDDLCIVCSGRFCCYLHKLPGRRIIRMRYFTAAQLSLAAGIIDAVAHCYATLGIATFQPLEEVIRQTGFVSPTIREVPI